VFWLSLHATPVTAAQADRDESIRLVIGSG
jgi:hypothetical protein